MSFAKKVRKNQVKAACANTENKFFGEYDWLIYNDSRVFNAGVWKVKEDCIGFVNALNGYLSYLETLDAKKYGVKKVLFQVGKGNIIGFDTWVVRSNIYDDAIPIIVVKSTPVIDSYMANYAKAMGMENNILISS